MPNMSIMRARCYLILQGLERSIAENVVRNFDAGRPDFLLQEEAGRALGRLREDMQDTAWGVEDINPIDLLQYLDLGGLVSLFNRHKSDVRNATAADIQRVTQIIERGSVYSIRNRVMHPVRPLEPEDFSTLSYVSKNLQEDAPNLIWEPLVESVALLSDAATIAGVSIPPFWVDDPRITHNLPVAEFDDTGFIGRTEERHRLKGLLQSDHNVITVVGAGGIGKTALALRVCYDLVDNPATGFDGVVWVSLKTHRLTADGVQEITDAITTTGHLVNQVVSLTGLAPDELKEPAWDTVLEYMKSNRMLLVIDNLETLGREVRDLAAGIPRQSKLLLTSRVGLGEIELRYAIPELSSKDSSYLMRTLGSNYGCPAIRRLHQDTLNDYCDRLHHNPLLIKWFVQAVSKGARPQDVLIHQDFDRALSFCLDNVYSALSESATDIVATLLAARRSLSRAQIREITTIERIRFEEALLELRQSNMIETKDEYNGGGVYQVTAQVLDYLSRHHPPSNEIVGTTRSLLRKWMQEQDQSAVSKSTYRYSKTYIHVETQDQRISAPYLRETLAALNKHDLPSAEASLTHAEELTPDWSEVYRVQAQLMELKESPVYDIESAYEASIRYGDNDISRRHYAVYLMSNHEHERALEQIDIALKHPDGLQHVLRSLRGVILMRSGYFDEAVLELESVWASRESNQSRFNLILQGTQFAEALRRSGEQLLALGKNDEAEQVLMKAINITEQTAEECGWDNKLTEVGIQTLSDSTRVPGISDAVKSEVTAVAERWDSDGAFVSQCTSYKTFTQFDRNEFLARTMPKASRHDQDAAVRTKLTGRIAKMMGRFGFIESESIRDVHLDATSVIDLGQWDYLSVGQEVVFDVVMNSQGPHAVRLEVITSKTSA